MKKNIILLSVCLSSLCSAAFAQEWKVAAFGQSTDLNFSSLIDPAKVGRNNAWLAGSKDFLIPGKTYTLPSDFIIESRGGKIANSHDGMTVFYTSVPVNQTFVLEADLTLEQIGPEVDGKSPAAQEAAGLFVRDIIGTPRQEPQSAGFEEFPQASNVLMNAFVTQNKKNDNLVQITSILREGVKNSWGNEGISIKKQAIVKNINFTEKTHIHMTIERTANQFILTTVDSESKEKKSWSLDDYAGFMNQQDDKSISLGFFASRNAKLEVKNARFEPGKETVDYAKLAPRKTNTGKKIVPELQLASPTKVVGNATTLQFLANQAGSVALAGSEQKKPVQAGELVQFPVNLNSGANSFTVNYLVNGVESQQTVQVEGITSQIANLSEIYVCTDCKNDAKGTKESPVDLKTAIDVLAPGGAIYLNDGQYDGLTLAREVSGLPGQLKTIVAINKHKAVFINNTFNLNASYWHLKDIVFDGNVDNAQNKPAYLRVSGSHNIVERVIARNNDDTGIAITAKDKNRLLWPAHNLILNSDSYNNLDLSGINADGFAAKLGVGPGNVFRGCISHHNADDGWDFFNKIEDGPNFPVTIENSVSYANGLPFSKPNILKGSIGNGFKLGGEGQPVNHKVINSVAFNNNMDGFTDNFNTGSLIIEGNISINSARYNYILRSNPYTIASEITFKNNYSIRDSWEGKIKDYLGDQVVSIDNKTLTSKEIGGIPKDIVISRDENGKIIYPEFLLKLNPNLS